MLLSICVKVLVLFWYLYTLCIDTKVIHVLCKCLFVCMYEDTQYNTFQEIHIDAIST